MDKKVIFTQDAPKPVGPYSQAVICNGMICLAGQIAIDPATGVMHAEGVHKDVRQIFANIEAILKAAGSSLQNIMKLTVYLTDINDIKFVNEVIEEIFTGRQYPARTTIQVSRLPKDAKVEIEAIASV